MHLPTRAVLFDVDFTLIEPRTMFRAEGYRASCARYGIDVDDSRFEVAAAEADAIFERAGGEPYDPEIFVAYTRRIIEQMGGTGARLDACAREICAEWASCGHFDLFDEVPAVLRALVDAGVRVGLISNSQRCLESFQSHFELRGLIDATVSSPDHGFMKPHPSIFSEAVRRLGVAPGESLMVGDNLRDDIEGALRAGLRAVLVHRAASPHPRSRELAARGIPVIRNLGEVLGLVKLSDLEP
jgi:putative hydrolase of the HAD superfamily